MHALAASISLLSLVLSWVAVVVVNSNTTGFAVDDLAAAFGAFGVILPIHGCSIATGLSDIRIGACAKVQTDTKTEVIG